VIHLRPHHLLCILTYIGEGYSKVFTENFTNIIESINAGEKDILITKGADDICTPRLNDPEDCHHCHEDRMIKRDAKALGDISKILNRKKPAYGEILTLDHDLIKKLRQSFKKNEIRSACSQCQWHDLCSEIAENNFHKTILS